MCTFCSTLIAPANQWLAANPGVEVVTCESCEIKVQRGHVPDNNVSAFYESGRFMSMFVRLLRCDHAGTNCIRSVRFTYFNDV